MDVSAGNIIGGHPILACFQLKHAPYSAHPKDKTKVRLKTEIILLFFLFKNKEENNKVIFTKMITSTITINLAMFHFQ